MYLTKTQVFDLVWLIITEMYPIKKKKENNLDFNIRLWTVIKIINKIVPFQKLLNLICID